MTDAIPAPPPLLVTCLCAQWCKLCGEYRGVFDAARAAFAQRTRFVWIDIEDDEAVVGPVDIDDFPTLLMARGDTPVFFGPLTPQPATLQRLLQSALVDDLGRLEDAELVALTARVSAWADIHPGSG